MTKMRDTTKNAERAERRAEKRLKDWQIKVARRVKREGYASETSLNNRRAAR